MDLFVGDTVFLGNGDGEFIVGQSYQVGGLFVLVQDFNGDGKADVAVSPGTATNGLGDGLDVLIGNGDGTFQIESYGTQNAPAGVVAADFNGDGKVDLAAADGASPDVSILLGLGDGSFVGKTDYLTNDVKGNAPDSLTTADFNNDGKLDLAVSDYGGDVSLFLGNGDGTFQPETAFAAGQYPSGIATGDFDHNNSADLVVVENGSNSVSILLGNGDGSFQPAVDYPTGPGPLGVVTGDFNGDSNLDLAVTNYGGNSVSILLGNGDGTFRNHVEFLTPMTAYGITAGDFRGIGRLDLAVTTSSAISVLLGNGDGTFQPHADYPGGWFLIVTGDFDGDGKLDLAAGGQVLLGNGDGTFRVGSRFGPGLGILSVSDFNGDGHLDLGVGGASSDHPAEMVMELGDGTGTFQKRVINYLMANIYITALLATDFNGDGVPDVATAGSLYDVSVMLSAAFRSVSPTALNFGSQGVGTTSLSQTLTISNSSNVPFDIANIVPSGDFSDTSACGARLNPETSCTIGVTFTPTGTGLEHGAITVTDSTRSSPQVIPLTGIGVSGPFLTPLPNRATFGGTAVGTSSAPLMAVLTNTGNAPVTLSTITLTGADNSDFQQTNNCGGSLSAGASCNVNVTFVPSVTGLRTASVAISDNAPGSPQAIPVFGAGLGLGLGIPSGGSGSVTVPAGQTANYTLAIGGAGMGGTATLSCTGAPKGAECSFPDGSSLNVSPDSASSSMSG